MSGKYLKLSDNQRHALELIVGDTKHHAEKNRQRKRGRIRHHIPEGYHHGGSRTLYSLERRGLVEKALHPQFASILVWTITDLGREALRA